MQDRSADVRYFCICEEEVLQHPIFSEAQVHAGRHHLLQEPLHSGLCISAILSLNHFGLVVGCKHQPKGVCIKPQLKHQHLSAFTQFILQTRKGIGEGGVMTCYFMSEWKNTTLNNYSYQLPVHLSFVTLYAVQLVFKNNWRQSVVEEPPREKCHEVFKGGFDVSCSLEMSKWKNNYAHL